MVKFCIESIFQSLPTAVIDYIKSLIFWTGIDVSVPLLIIDKIWNISRHEANKIIDILWAYGLIQIADRILSPDNKVQQFVSVHMVISQYVIENVTAHEFKKLTPYGKNTDSIIDEQHKLYDNVFESKDLLKLLPSDYLRYMFNKMIYEVFPFYIVTICNLAISDPLQVKFILQTLQDTLTNPQNFAQTVNPVCTDISRLINDCTSALRNAPKTCRSLNQTVQRYLMEGDYHNLVETIKQYLYRNPICLIAKHSLGILPKLIPTCDNLLQYYVRITCKKLQLLTPEYHKITLLHLPLICLLIKQLEMINNSLQIGSPDIEFTYHYCKYLVCKERKFIWDSMITKLQNVSPAHVQMMKKQINNVQLFT